MYVCVHVPTVCVCVCVRGKCWLDSALCFYLVGSQGESSGLQILFQPTHLTSPLCVLQEIKYSGLVCLSFLRGRTLAQRVGLAGVHHYGVSVTERTQGCEVLFGLRVSEGSAHGGLALGVWSEHRGNRKVRWGEQFTSWGREREKEDSGGQDVIPRTSPKPCFFQ